MKSKLFTLLLFLLLTTPCHADKKTTLADQVYVKSGLAKQIPNMTKQMDATAKAFEKNLPPKMLKEFNREIKRLFNPVLLEAKIRKNLSDNANEPILNHMLKWYNSELGKKITKIEENNSNPENARKKIHFINKTQNFKNFPEKRVNLVKRLINSINTVDYVVDVGLYINISILDTINELNPNTKPLTKQQLMHFFHSQRAAMKLKIEKQMTLSFLYSYKSLNDDELEKYVRFNELEKSKKFNTIIVNSILRSIYSKHTLI